MRFIVTGNHDIPIDDDEGRTDTDNDNTRPATPYSIVPRSDAAVTADKRMEKVRWWLETLERPAAMTDMEYKSFMWYSMEFFISGNRLWQKDPKRQHKIVISQDHQLFLISSAHDDVGHRGFYATNSLLSDHYWWPMMSHDIAWFIRTCWLCQLRKTQQVSIPPVVVMRHLPLSFKSLYGYYAPDAIFRIQVYHTGSLLSYSLARMENALQRIS